MKVTKRRGIVILYKQRLLVALSERRYFRFYGIDRIKQDLQGGEDSETFKSGWRREQIDTHAHSMELGQIKR
jgi:hypothetical protein